MRGLRETRREPWIFRPMLLGRSVHAGSVAFEIVSDLTARKWLRHRRRPPHFGPPTGGRFLCLGRGIEHRIDAVGETLELTAAGGTARPSPALEGAVNSFAHGAERDARLLPGFDNGPVERRDQQMRPALAPEVLLDFRKIVEVVERFHQRGA